MSITLYQIHINTPIGTLIALTDENYLYCLQYEDIQATALCIEQIAQQHRASIIKKPNALSIYLQQELHNYFARQLTIFQTPINIIGTPFTKKVLHAVSQILYSQIYTYSDIARQVGNVNASRAVGRVLAQNNILLLIPCHRIIATNGTLTGYRGQLSRKAWLLNHEKIEA